MKRISLTLLLLFVWALPAFAQFTPGGSSGAGGGAPDDAPYITSTAVGGLSAEVPLSGLSTGCVGVTTTTGALAGRTITGTASEISVANGNCSGNPTLSLPSAIDLGGKTVEIPNSTSLPGTCNVGEMYMDTDATSGQRFYLCQSANTWALQGDGGGTNALLDGSNHTDTLTGTVVRGDIICGNSTPKWARLARGSTGQVLFTNSSGDCEWGSVDISNTTVTLTEKTLNAESSGNVITLPKRLWFPAAACNNATAGPIWSLPASNAPAVACDTGTNTQAGTLAFDASTDESAQVDYLLPTTWTGAVDARVLWKAAATSGATGWCVQLISVADAETSDPAYPAQGAGNCVSDTAKGTTLQENIASITGVTATGVAAGERLFIKISRDANGGAVTDDMTGDALLIGVELTIREAM